MTNATPTDPLIGTVVSQYDVLAKLGGGGMGVVYQARDIKLGRIVALKFLPPQWSHDESAKQRFVREAQAASATHHRNICVIHNIEETGDGRLFIVMAYYEGETLKQRLERGALAIADAIEIGSEIAEGLAKAHSQGVVHRDVKPGNIIVTDDGAKILDFGLAKFADALQLTVPGSTIGTVAYMSPEQTRGEEADAKSDIWALGVVLYEMLAGTVPFRGGYPEATFHAIKHEPVPSLHAARRETPEALERIVMRALEKDPAKRYQSVREPARELRLLQGRTVPIDLRTEELPTMLGRPGAMGRARQRRRSWRRVVAAAAVIAVAATAGFYAWSRRPVERIPVAIAPVANHTGLTELDRYRLALTETFIDELTGSPNIRVVPYLRLMEMIRPFAGTSDDVSSSEAIHAVATESGAPFVVVPTLVYRDRDSTWLMQVQVRNGETGTNVASYETAPVTSSLSHQTAFRLVTAAADSIQQHFKTNGPGRSFTARPAASRFRDPDAAWKFEAGLNQYAQMEYAAAGDAFVESARLDDQHAPTHAWLSRVRLLLSRRNEAIAAAERARSLLTPGSARDEVAFVDAVLAESQSDVEGAERAYRQLAALAPDEPWALTELADFLKRRQDRNQPAIEAYHDVLRRDSSFIRPHVELCQLYTRIDDHPLAEKEGRLALERYRATGGAGGRAQALLCLGDGQRAQGGVHLADARRHIEEARTLIASDNLPYSLARAVFYQGLVEYSDSRYRAAVQFFEDAASRLHAVGNRVIEGVALMNLGVTNFLLGQPTRSFSFYGQSRDVFMQVGDERRVAEADVNAAGVQIEFGDRLPDALKKLANARVNLERLGHVSFQITAMLGEADSYRHSGQLDRARQLLRTASEVARDKQLTSKTSAVGLALAQTDIQANEYDAARKALEGLVGPASGAGDEEARIALGTVLTRVGNFGEARRHLERALADVDGRQLSGLVPLAHTALGALEYETKQLARARTHFDQAIASWTDSLPNGAAVEAGCYRGLLDGIAGRQAQARLDLERGINDARRMGRFGLEAQCRAQLARLDATSGRAAAAVALLAEVPEDGPERTLGPELRAFVEYWRGRALAGARSPGADVHTESARERLRQVQSRLPEEFRSRFAARPDIEVMLRADR